ncbi:sigma 54-interacting transcriptional regulator [Chitinophaga agri]|uniref:Response regulator n=1 Tax=Chitinophaga agri TaxID=2703787 RepID=A0A6B9ZDV8_9BACT|nr:sigma 54-interacting transcriptional regulator [Chitinophaga agri]QHS59681.1 response regulator [Chitinophaga agri]
MKKQILIVEDEFIVANNLRLLLLEAGFEVCGIADSYQEALDMLELHQPMFVLLDIFLKGEKSGIDLAAVLSEKGIAFIYLSANDNQQVLEAATVTQPYGFLVKPFRKKDILATLEIAQYRHAHGVEARLRREQSLQVDLTNMLTGTAVLTERLRQMATRLQDVIPFDYALFGLIQPGEQAFRAGSYFRIGFDDYQTIQLPDLKNLIGATSEELSALSDEATISPGEVFNEADFESLSRRVPVKRLLSKKLGLNSHLEIPLSMTRKGMFLFSFYSRRSDTYTADHLELLRRLQPSLQLAMDRLLAFEEIEKLTEQLKRENIYLQEEVKTSANFEEIIGTSCKMVQVFDLVSQVAPMDTNVLLLGESGTGKELVARAIHNLSLRKDKLLIKMNCATLPANLIESELFGHEKGAFTGAMEKRIGKFELAQGGTIFLDEIGELPIDLQAKLLRVLQEKEIERIGGNQTIQVNVRIIAATNRNLEREISAGKFRLDLYYRLNVFPILLPPLRERTEDIPLLASFFGQKMARKTGKPFLGIKAEALEEMLQYHWPGNIREMENLIEQALVLNDGRSPLQWGRSLLRELTVLPSPDHSANMSSQSLDHIRELQQATEREYILSILRKTNGRIRGTGGAAELLKLKPTTLESRMEKLGIKKMHILQGKPTGV